MNQELFRTSKYILRNYFVPFSNGKFIASCLMLNSDVYPILSKEELFRRLTDTSIDSWPQIEYSDIDFWFKDHAVDWFNTTNWYENIKDQPISGIQSNRYVIYSYHPGIENFMLNLFPNSRCITTVPDVELCKKNYSNKNWVVSEPFFESSRVQQDLKNFKVADGDLIFYQSNILHEEKFINNMLDIADQLKISLDLELVCAYRKTYMNCKFNQYV